ncbi:hypothetical protein EIP91_007124 [Steccherinum ochraceum]|uniref:Uncharacterized protein n=1 Tax=Steccherinum ochraceum TaxID=92696 RepID=A0A4R0R745_9APHY|nr:hypothetical protein EIP91_007124 [Steccherinum ochraceum]
MLNFEDLLCSVVRHWSNTLRESDSVPVLSAISFSLHDFTGHQEFFSTNVSLGLSGYDRCRGAPTPTKSSQREQVIIRPLPLSPSMFDSLRPSLAWDRPQQPPPTSCGPQHFNSHKQSHFTDFAPFPVFPAVLHCFSSRASDSAAQALITRPKQMSKMSKRLGDPESFLPQTIFRRASEVLVFVLSSSGQHSGDPGLSVAILELIAPFRGDSAQNIRFRVHCRKSAQRSDERSASTELPDLEVALGSQVTERLAPKSPRKPSGGHLAVHTSVLVAEDTAWTYTRPFSKWRHEQIRRWAGNAKSPIRLPGGEGDARERRAVLAGGCIGVYFTRFQIAGATVAAFQNSRQGGSSLFAVILHCNLFAHPYAPRVSRLSTTALTVRPLPALDSQESNVPAPKADFTPAALTLPAQRHPPARSFGARPTCSKRRVHSFRRRPATTIFSRSSNSATGQMRNFKVRFSAPTCVPSDVEEIPRPWFVSHRAARVGRIEGARGREEWQRCRERSF